MKSYIQQGADLVWRRWLKVPYSLYAHSFHRPKKYRTTVVLLHGIGSSHETWRPVMPYFKDDVRVIAFDLLGFGKSPKPRWALYNVKTQARSVMKSLIDARVAGKIIIIGHSLGSLVAIDFARRYPFAVDRLVLCSPPIYRPQLTDKGTLSRDDSLRRFYRALKKHPNSLKKLAPLAINLGLANDTLRVNDENIESYVQSLELGIINQNSIHDIEKITKPITIFYGVLDPVVVGSNLNRIAKDRPNIKLYTLVAGHELMGSYVKKLGEYIKQNI